MYQKIVLQDENKKKSKFEFFFLFLFKQLPIFLVSEDTIKWPKCQDSCFAFGINITFFMERSRLWDIGNDCITSALGP